MKPRVSASIKSNGHSKAPLKKLRRSELAEFEDAFLLQKELLATRDYAQAVIEAVPPLLVLDQKLRVQTANASFCKCFKISLRQTLNRKVYELGNGQWNIPTLRTMLEEVLPKKRVFKNYEVTHKFDGLGIRTMLLSGRQVDHIRRILLVIEDITERRAEQAGIRTSEIRYRRLFEAARDGILILDPNTRKITDANPFMSELLGYPHKELLGKELWEIGLLKDEKPVGPLFASCERSISSVTRTCRSRTKPASAMKSSLSAISTTKTGERSFSATSAISRSENGPKSLYAPVRNAFAPSSIWGRSPSIPVMPRERSRSSTVAPPNCGDENQSLGSMVSMYVVRLKCICPTAHPSPTRTAQ